MHHADKQITLYNALYDKQAGYDIYKRTLLDGVSMFSRIQTSVSSDGGLQAANEYTLRIPGELCAEYVAPKDFTGAEGIWTLQPGDIVIMGEATEVNPRPAELKKAYKDIMTVIGVTDNRLSKGAHIKVVGK